MRLVKLILLVGIWAGYPSHGQEVVNNGKSIAPIPAQTTAKTTTSTATIAGGQKQDALLPDNIKLIIGQGADRNYYVRVREVHNLKKNLAPEQIDALYKFLYEKLWKQELPDLLTV
ncbi:MAG: hypothetical protein WCV67_18975 [Victivallaceae bacterium]